MNLESVSRIARIALSRPVLLAVAGGSLLLLLGECHAFRNARKVESAPRVAVNVPQFERYKPEAIEATIQTWRPPEREARKIERAFGVSIRAENELDGADLLAHKEVTVDCGDGETRRVEILATLPDGDGPREVEIRTVQSGRKFFGLRARYEIGGLYGRSFDGSTRSRAWAATEPARLGRFYLRAEAGFDVRSGESDAYALVGVVWRSR